MFALGGGMMPAPALACQYSYYKLDEGSGVLLKDYAPLSQQLLGDLTYDGDIGEEWSAVSGMFSPSNQKGYQANKHLDLGTLELTGGQFIVAAGIQATSDVPSSNQYLLSLGEYGATDLTTVIYTTARKLGVQWFGQNAPGSGNSMNTASALTADQLYSVVSVVDYSNEEINIYLDGVAGTPVSMTIAKSASVPGARASACVFNTQGVGGLEGNVAVKKLLLMKVVGDWSANLDDFANAWTGRLAYDLLPMVAHGA